MAVSRKLRAGCRRGKLRICCKISGEALNKTQCSPSPLTVIDDCVRAVNSGEPQRTALQFGQLQFHCGKPPPAAEPKTLIFKMRVSLLLFISRHKPPNIHRSGCVLGVQRSTVGDVHRDFKAKTHVAGCWFFPIHKLLLMINPQIAVIRRTACLIPKSKYPDKRSRMPHKILEIDLMISMSFQLRTGLDTQGSSILGSIAIASRP